MKEPIEGFLPPTAPPSNDVDFLASIDDLFDSAPSWNKYNASFGHELCHLFRNHVAIRSAIGFAMELANEYDKTLKTSKDAPQIFHAQGAFEALSRFTSALLTEMRTAQNKETPQ